MNSRPSDSKPSTAFDRLAEPVRRWIWRKAWTSLHDIQERAIHALLDHDSDVVIAAPTAGGKTEAAFLPLISSVVEEPGDGGFDLVYIGPLRALINDQFERLDDLCGTTGLPVYPWHGDVSAGMKRRARTNPRGVLLITPESLEALFVLRGPEIPAFFAGTRAVVVDELHALLDTERGVHLRSLLTRMELATGHRIRRVGLSATLGEMSLVREYLRPETPGAVAVLESRTDVQELKVQLRAYLQRRNPTPHEVNDEEPFAAPRAVARHLFSRLRGARNLVFAGSRASVEWYADALREMSERARLPVEFFPHHASLSREHRTHLEHRLRTHPATTAVCTSTLELGIDIGDIACVAQIGAPFSVASLRQRLGRSGRRTGQPAVLRLYAVEKEPNGDSHPLDRLHIGLVRSIAMVELLIEGWCEPPAPEALHLSTLTHQILSVIAELGGTSARRLHATLCERGPFHQVDAGLFARVLTQLGRADLALVEQAPDGTLLLGREGERLVEHYSFYAAFQTSEEYRVVVGSKSLGTLPLAAVLTPGMTIVFSGRRWRIIDIRDREKIIEVSADRGGRPPPFGGSDGGIIHDRVAEKMMEVLAASARPTYIEDTAARLLEDARAECLRLNLVDRPVCAFGERDSLVATSSGTVKTATLGLALRRMGLRVEIHDAFLQVTCPDDQHIPSVEDALKTITESPPTSVGDVLEGTENLITEKYHPYLTPDLLLADAVGSRVDLDALPVLAQRLTNAPSGRNVR